MQPGVLPEGPGEPGVGVLEFGDGGGLGPDVLGLLRGQVLEGQRQRGVEGEERGERDPVGAVDRRQSAGLGAGHGGGGDHQSDPHRAAGQQPVGVEVAEHGVHREEGVEPGQDGGEDGPQDVVDDAGRPARAAPEVQHQGGGDQSGRGELRGPAHQQARGGRGQQRPGGEQGVRSPAEEPVPPHLDRPCPVRPDPARSDLHRRLHHLSLPAPLRLTPSGTSGRPPPAGR